VGQLGTSLRPVPVNSTRGDGSGVHSAGGRKSAVGPAGRPTNSNLYAGPDGKVYRHSESGSWQRNDGKSWNDAPQASANMSKEQSARDWGNYRESPKGTRPSGSYPSRAGQGSGRRR